VSPAASVTSVSCLSPASCQAESVPMPPGQRAAVRCAESDQCGAATRAAKRAEPVPGDKPAHGVSDHHDPPCFRPLVTGQQIKPPLNLITQPQCGGAHSTAEVIREQH
jgi:hypothetical protein